MNTFKKHKHIITFISYMLYLYLKFAFWTSEFKLRGLKHNICDLKKENGTIFLLWHNNLCYALKFFEQCYNIYPLISQHNDGAIIYNIIKRFGFINVIRGSSKKGAVIALRKIIKVLASGGNILITPDGPRGPRHVIHNNIFIIASKYAKKIVAISCVTDKCFILNTWDRFILPKPFANITISAHEAYVSTSNNISNILCLTQNLNNQ